MVTGGDGTEQQRDREASVEKRFLALASGLRSQQEQEQRGEETGSEEGGDGDLGGDGAGEKGGQGQMSGVDELRERFRRVFEGRYVAGDSTMAVMGGSENDIDGEVAGEGDEPDISVCLHIGLLSMRFLRYTKSVAFIVGVNGNIEAFPRCPG